MPPFDTIFEYQVSGLHVPLYVYVTSASYPVGVRILRLYTHPILSISVRYGTYVRLLSFHTLLTVPDLDVAR